jgi:hypothetical protein
MGLELANRLVVISMKAVEKELDKTLVKGVKENWEAYVCGACCSVHICKRLVIQNVAASHHDRRFKSVTSSCHIDLSHCK